MKLLEPMVTLDQRSDLPEQYRAIGWVNAVLYAVIFEIREDEQTFLRQVLDQHYLAQNIRHSPHP